MSTTNGNALTARQREMLLICLRHPDGTDNQFARAIRRETGMALTSALGHVQRLKGKGYLNGQAPAGPAVCPTPPAGDPDLLRELMAWLPGLSMYVKGDQEKRQDFMRRLAEAVKAEEWAKRPAGA